MYHLMVDLETMGVAPSAPIVTMSAVFFDPDTGETGAEFSAKVSVESNMRMGRIPESGTLEWWMGQSDAARASLFPKGGERAIPLSEALGKLKEFIESNSSNDKSGRNRGAVVWSNGANFDIVLLTHAFDQVGMEVPWKYWDTRDVRTIVDLSSPTIKKNDVPIDGTAHAALDDAKHQAKYVSLMWQTLRSGLIPNTKN